MLFRRWLRTERAHGCTDTHAAARSPTGIAGVTGKEAALPVSVRSLRHVGNIGKRVAGKLSAAWVCTSERPKNGKGRRGTPCEGRSRQSYPPSRRHRFGTNRVCEALKGPPSIAPAWRNSTNNKATRRTSCFGSSPTRQWSRSHGRRSHGAF